VRWLKAMASFVPMSFRGLLALACLLGALGAERMAYYGSRATFALEMSRNGMPTAQIGITFTVLQIVGLVCLFLGAGLAVGIGARLSAALGAVVALMGFLCLVVQAPLLLGWALITAGSSVFRVGVYGAAAELIGGTSDALASARASNHQKIAEMAAFTTLASALVDVVAMAASAGFGALHVRFGSTHGFALALLVLSLFFIGGAIVVDLADRRGAPEKAPPQDPYRAPAMPQAPPVPVPSMVNPFAGLAVLGCALGALQGSESFGQPSFDLPSATIGLIYALGGVFGLVTAAIVCGGVLIGVLLRRPMPLIAIFGGATALGGLGVLIKAFAGGTVVLHCIGSFFTSAGYAAIPLGLAYAALSVRARFSGLMIATWFGVGIFAGMIGTPIANTSLRTPVGVLAGLAIVVGGIALVFVGRRVQSWFEPAPPPPIPQG
jgi:hypothetical protein